MEIHIFFSWIQGAKDFSNKFIDEYNNGTQFPVKWNDLTHFSLRLLFNDQRVA